MKKLLVFLLFVLILQNGFSQVGINTTSPNAQLDIRSSNQATPSNTDGILIPKIDAFPITNPTAVQTGMMVYLTTTSAGKSPGFYYWNNATTSWLPVSKTDDDWYEIGSTNPPNDITDDMYHTGNVAIGRTTALAKLDLEQTGSTTYAARFRHSNPPNIFSSIVIDNVIVSNQASGVVTGVNNLVTANNSVIGYGVYNNLQGNTSDSQTGIGNVFPIAGSNYRMGVYNGFLDGTGARSGLYNYFTGSGFTQRGVLNQFTGTPTDTSYGVLNDFNDTSSLPKKGVYNTFTNNVTTNGDNYGMHNVFDGVGNSNKFGVRNQVSGNGGGSFYGDYNNLTNFGTGSLYGSHSILDGSGTGDKIGTSVVIYPSAGGNHYGIHSQVTKPTGYAGYFLGRVAIGTTAVNNYILPSTRGTANQIMQTDGAGNVTWQNPNTVLNNFAWTTTGNSGTNASTNFIGTTDNVDLIFKRNNTQAGTIGATNSSFGLNSLFSNVSGNYNAAFGNSSMYSNTTGIENSAFGENSLRANTTGYRNCSFGRNSLFSNISGAQNVAFGHSTLVSNTIGDSNSAFGSFAMSNLISGSDNLALGISALSNNVTGNGNIAIGNRAGYNEMGSNKLYIENSISPTPLIYGEFDTDILRSNSQRFFVNDPTVNGIQMMLKNSDRYNHGTDTNLDFGTVGGNFLMATAESQTETAGIRGDGDNISIWSPGDSGRQLRILDEDAWTDNNGNPYDNAAEVAYIAPNGQYFQVSDRNKKENIRKIQNATNKITQISGYTYQFKLKPTEAEKGEKLTASSGVLAQEIETVLPEAIQKNEYGEYFVDYAAITPLLIEAIKEQNTKIQSLEQRLQQLEEKVSK
jgi:trimeric autotransporter adhesin